MPHVRTCEDASRVAKVVKAVKDVPRGRWTSLLKMKVDSVFGSVHVFVCVHA